MSLYRMTYLQQRLVSAIATWGRTLPIDSCHANGLRECGPIKSKLTNLTKGVAAAVGLYSGCGGGGGLGCCYSNRSGNYKTYSCTNNLIGQWSPGRLVSMVTVMSAGSDSTSQWYLYNEKAA